MKKLVLFIVVVIVAIILGYYFYGQNIDLIRPKPYYPWNNASTTTTTNTATSSQTIDISQFSEADTSSWKTFSSQELGYSIKYPKDFIMVTNGSVVQFSVPDGKYFTWPLLDDVRIDINTVGKCKFEYGEERPGVNENITLNNYSINITSTVGVGAGQLYTEYLYKIDNASSTYCINVLRHSANGAGLYVSDATLVEQYNKEHDENVKKLNTVIYGMINSFRSIIQPEGMSEDKIKR